MILSNLTVFERYSTVKRQHYQPILIKIIFLPAEDFMAHGADVKCLGLGHKSGRVLVTGGDDRKVNLWSVGKPHSIMVI